MTSILSESEKALIADCATGCEHGWRRFSVQYGRLIRAIAASACTQWGTPDQEVDDLVGYVYEKLIEDGYRRLRAWRHKSTFSTYLVQVTKNLCIDYLKRHRRFMDRHVMTGGDETRETPDARPSIPEELDNAGLLNRLDLVIASLSPKQALILKLRLSGKSLRDIAKIMGLPEGTVFGENARAVNRLRELLGPEDGDSLTPSLEDE